MYNVRLPLYRERRLFAELEDSNIDFCGTFDNNNSIKKCNIQIRSFLNFGRGFRVWFVCIREFIKLFV